MKIRIKTNSSVTPAPFHVGVNYAGRYQVVKEKGKNVKISKLKLA